MKLTKVQRQALRKALHTLAKDGPVNTHNGICYNLNKLVVQGERFIDTYTFVGSVSVTWPEVDRGRIWACAENGELCVYPIAPKYAADGCRLPYWEGAQLEKRMSLIKYLLDWLGDE